MKNNFDVIVIGAGASGSACAIKCAESGFNVLLLEKSNKIAKKLLVTGNGRCNLGNVNMNSSFYNKNVDEIIEQDVNSFFDEIGIETYADEEGRLYPISNMAQSVTTAINKKIDALKIVAKTNSSVISAQKRNDLFEITIESGEKFFSKFLVCATGVLGAEKIFQNFGHKLLPHKNVLCGLECQKYNKNLFGIRQNAKVICKKQNRIFEEMGQVQFKKNGVSGIVIFNLSAFLAKNDLEKTNISLNLLPQFSKEEIINMLNKKQKICPYLKVMDLLLGIFPFALAEDIIKKSGLKNPEDNISALSKTEIENVVYIITNYELEVVKTLDEPQVVAGGFDDNEFEKLESKKQENFFVLGEASGVFGICGGYNLHYAFGSGIYIAKKIKEKNEIYNK